MADYNGVIDIVDPDGSVVGTARALLDRNGSSQNPERWTGRLDVPSTPALTDWLKRTRHDIRFRTPDGRAAACHSNSFPARLPGSIDVFGGKDAPFD